MKERLTATLLCSLLMLWPIAGHSSTVCYDDSPFPSAIQLNKADNGAVVALLGGRHLDAEFRGPLVRFTADGDWKDTGRRKCADWRCESDNEPRTPSCRDLIPPVKTANGKRRVSACARHGKHIYFGLDTYRGEANQERGAIGRYDPESGELQLRKLPQIHDKSVTALVHDGQSLWVATEHSTECSGGRLPGLPLSQYDWKRDRWLEVRSRGCGLVTHDMLLAGENLWLATDMGITRIRYDDVSYWGASSPDDVVHYTALAPEHPIPEQTQCPILYEQMLGTLPAQIKGAEAQSPFGVFFQALAHQRPAYLQEDFIDRNRKRPADALWNAMRSHQLAEIKRLRSEGVDPWWPGTEGDTPIEQAVEAGDLKALKLLQSVRAIDWAREIAHRTSLLARAQKRPELFDWLAGQGARPDHSLLISLMNSGQLKLFARLLKNGVLDDPYSRESLLLRALKAGAPEFAHALIDHGLTGEMPPYDEHRHPMIIALQKNYGGLALRMSELPLTPGVLAWLLENDKREIFTEAATANAPLRDQGLEAFKIAVAADDSDAAEHLLNSGLELPSHRKRSYLQTALGKKRRPMVALLLRHGFADTVEAPLMKRLLPIAMEFNLSRFIERASKLGVTLDAPMAQEILVNAVGRGEVALARRMIAAGADVNQRRRVLHSPLTGDLIGKCLGEMREKPACYRGGSLLIDAVRSGGGEMVALLLDSGGDTGLRGPVGATPLLVAAGEDRPGIFRQLTKHGAKWSERDDLGNSALHYAAFHRSNEAAQSIIERAPGLVDATNAAGTAPLHLAAEKGFRDLTVMLLEHGATPDTEMWPEKRTRLTNPPKRLPPTPGLIVKRAGKAPMPVNGGQLGKAVVMASSVHMPIKKKPSGPGKTPEDLARQNGHTAIAQLLERTTR